MIHVHRDPTFDRAYGLEIREKAGCDICQHRRIQVVGGAKCRKGKTFPDCREHKKGYAIDNGRAA